MTSLASYANLSNIILESYLYDNLTFYQFYFVFYCKVENFYV